MNSFIVKDSGNRQEFETGSVRDTDENKADYSLLSHHANKRTAIHLGKGARKYGRRNWEKGQPVSRFLASAMRHIEDFRSGDRTEDHLAAARFNIDAIMHMEEEAAAGKVAYQKMLDLDFYPAWDGEERVVDQTIEEMIEEMGGRQAIIDKTTQEVREEERFASWMLNRQIMYILQNWHRFSDDPNAGLKDGVGLIPGEIQRAIQHQFGETISTQVIIGRLNYLQSQNRVGSRGRHTSLGVQTFYYAL